ncbi:hypothetical protein [Leuconostoc citreum]|uniref:hypothetical protein n=1 Tax=Leuconostoc citreum TaxID=33964 RepID=UPI0032DF6446
MKKSKQIWQITTNYLTASSHKILASVMATIPWLIPITASADIGDAAKSTGTSLTKIIYIIVMVVGGVCLLIAFGMKATGSERMNQKGNDKLFKSLVGVGGALLTGLLLSWIVSTMSSAGGGNFISWPF